MEALGVAMAAGQADGVGVWDLYKEPETAITHDVFIPTTTHEGKQIKVQALVHILSGINIILDTQLTKSLPRN
jgi:hypothetical protein